MAEAVCEPSMVADRNHDIHGIRTELEQEAERALAIDADIKRKVAAHADIRGAWPAGAAAAMTQAITAYTDSVDRLTVLPALTLADARAKARVLLAVSTDDCALPLAVSLAQDILRLVH
jgi:hypothetical protein